MLVCRRFSDSQPREGRMLVHLVHYFAFRPEEEFSHDHIHQRP